ncbi:AraC family transcriptional regulator [Vibrio sp. 10N]|uniref:AraC family transcriptional regulator n=1 Tax=Vibrio sp. 10N TaxID=3058938 RepID=UPI00281310B1|nr:helix-turn-helix transcriptional regulator [Vibrio sp. 10N]
MAIIDETTRFDADSIDNQVIGIAATVGTHDSGMHHHQKNQLLFAASGCMSISLDGAMCILPPTRAAWIPAGVEHYAKMSNVVAYRSLYFDAKLCADLPDSVTVFSINPLLRALIERMAFWEWDRPQAEQMNMTALFFEELRAAPKEALALPLPSDRRLQRWLEGVIGDQYLPQPLNQVAASVGASAKTVTRIFTKETGMPYQSWRQQWRLLMAIQSLSEGNSVADTAAALEFSSDSAFVAFFRQQTGETPGKYIIEGS